MSSVKRVDDDRSGLRVGSAGPDGEPAPAGRVLMFDLATGGHHVDYARYLVEYWRHNVSNGQLQVVMHPGLLQKWDPTFGGGSEPEPSNVFFQLVSREEADWAANCHWLLSIFREWALVRRYVQRLRPDHCLLLYFDRYQLPLALRPVPDCAVSGIYFRPAFHYADWLGQHERPGERVRAVRQKLLLRTLLRAKRLHTLFCLDPYAVEPINRLASREVAVYLPDPIRVGGDDALRGVRLRQDLGISGDRTVLLMFGSLAERKGVFELLQALDMLPSDVSGAFCLLLVGEVNARDQDRLERAVHTLQSRAPIKVIRHQTFVREQDIQSYFHAADLVLAPYQRHVGSSGIVIRAAAAGRPVLASDYGLVGELVRRHKLGCTVDATEPIQIAAALQAALAAPTEAIHDRDEALRFASSHTAEAFAAQLRAFLCTRGRHDGSGAEGREGTTFPWD